MKKILVGMLLLGSISSFADCRVMVINDGAVNHILDFAKDKMVEKGYEIVYDILDADYTLSLDTQSNGSTQEHNVTVGASTVLKEISSQRIKFVEHKYKGGVDAFGINRLQRTSIAKKQIKGIPSCE